MRIKSLKGRVRTQGGAWLNFRPIRFATGLFRVISALFRVNSGMFRSISGLFRSGFGLFRVIPACTGLHRHKNIGGGGQPVVAVSRKAVSATFHGTNAYRTKIVTSLRARCSPMVLGSLGTGVPLPCRGKEGRCGTQTTLSQKGIAAQAKVRVNRWNRDFKLRHSARGSHFPLCTLHYALRTRNMPPTLILDVERLTKTYASPAGPLTVLNEVSFAIQQGEAVAIVGPSGSGKTTLLGLCAGLDSPTSGTVRLDGVDLPHLDEDGRARLRNQAVGFVFQNFQLVPSLTALENVMVPLELRGDSKARPRAESLLERTGLGDRTGHFPAQLSGGEQQRVAIARAFINEPKVLFADEPTGNLDGANSELVMSLLFELNGESGAALVLVTHNLELARRTQRIITLRSGALVSDQPTRQ